MIHYLCALRGEAIPLIEQYKLRHYSPANLFNIYTNAEKGVSLTLSGMGKLAASAAALYTYTVLKCDAGEIWLNVGIAGHQSHPLGSIYVAHRVEDAGTAKCWYPQLVVDSGIPSESLITLDRPSANYASSLYDMEASGFISSASRFASMEFIHCIKVISDNAYNPVRKIKQDEIRQLIETHRNTISTFASQLLIVSNELKTTVDISDFFNLFTQQWHFTQYQRNQLRRILHRWQLLLPASSPLDLVKNSNEDAGKILELLTQQMDNTVFHLDGRKDNV